MLKKLILLYSIILCFNSVFAVDNIFTGAGDGSSWSDTSNWSQGTLPVYNTDSSEYTYIGKDATSSLDIHIDGDARSGRAWLGRPEDPAGTYSLTLDGVDAFYYLIRLYIGPKGVFVMNGGEFNTWEGRFAGATMTINSGLFTIRSNWWAFFADASLTLNGGTLKIRNGSSFSRNVANDLTAPNPEFTGVIDLCGGQIVMQGDCREALQWHIDNGNITAYNGDPYYEIELSYNASSDTTTVKALNVMAARNVWPLHGSALTVDQRYTIQFNWEKGRDAGRIEGYNVYIADPNTGVFDLLSDPVEPYEGTSWQVTVDLGATYSWRIDEVLDDGNSTVVTGEIWDVSIDSELLSIYERLQDGNYHTLDYQWIGCGDGKSWNDELNWHSEVENLPIPTYDGHEGDRIECRTDVSISTSDFCSGGNLWLGYDGLSQVINVDDEDYWQMYRVYIAGDGTVNVDPDSTVRWILLESLGGLINLEGYMRISSGHWSFDQSSTGRGGIKIRSGRLWIENMPTYIPFNEGDSGNIDIYDGFVVFDGDQSATVQSWVDEGYIIGYGDPNSAVDVSYDMQAEQTFVTTRQNGTVAYDPIPADLSTDVDINSSLNWVGGDNVDSDTLYLAKWLESDLDGDGYVTEEDLILLAINFLQESWLEVDASDVNSDNELNLRDLALMAGQWGQSVALSQIDTFIHSEPNGVYTSENLLEPDSKYVWRIDSNTDEGVVSGDQWTFTTAGDSLTAYNPWPVDGDNNIVNGSISLTWITGSAIDSCDVYFGDVFSVVANADTSSDSYKANTSSGNWAAPSLTSGERYYWRIDTIEGSTVHKGKVWTFKVTDVPAGLYVESGILKLNGQQFKGYGVNYIDPFTRRVEDQADASYEEGFTVLGEKNIPFARIWAGGMYANEWDLYFEDKEQYFQILDDVMASADQNNVGIIFSMFWTWYTLPDLVGDHISQWGDSQSATCAFMENYIREIYARYKNCPAFWGWELGNEYNYHAKDNALAPVKLPIYGHPASRDNVLDRIDMPLARDIATNFTAAVRKVDKNRIISNGFGINTSGEEYADHEMMDVVSIHYYATGDATPTVLANAVTTAQSWGKPLYVGEFGVSSGNSLGFATVEEAFDDMLDDLVNANVVFASMWIYDHKDENLNWNVTDENSRAYMLDKLSAVNAAMNQ